MSATNKVLVTGASGLLGGAAIERFLSAGWEVVGVSRRKPQLPSGRDIEFLSVDLRDKQAARVALERLTDITHIAYTALHEKPELVAGWSSKEQIGTNNAMLHNVVEPIVRVATNFRHISILQGTKIYGVHLHPIPIPARERDARKDHENFFFDQEAYVREMGARHGFNYTALRPQLVTGATPGALNVLPAEPAGTCRPGRSARGLRIRLRRPGRTPGIREHRQAAPGRVHQDGRYRGRLRQGATVLARSQTAAARHKIIGPGYARSFWVT